MEAKVVSAKIESLTRCLQRLESKTPMSKDILISDPDIQDIIAVNLQRAVQRSVDLGLYVLVDYSQSPANTMADVFTALEENRIITPEIKNTLNVAAEFRSVSIHEFLSIDWDFVWDFLDEGLYAFWEYQKVLAGLIAQLLKLIWLNFSARS